MKNSKNTTTKSRLIDFLAFKNVKKSNFYKTTRLGNGFLDKNNNINSDKIEIIASFYPELNIEWLITGRGQMLRDDSNADAQRPAPTNDTSLMDKLIQQTEKVGELKTENRHQVERINALSTENKHHIEQISSLKNENERLKNENRRLRDVIHSQHTTASEVPKLPEPSARIASEPPITHIRKQKNDVNAKQNIPQM
jgi:regulator of replication initiation timing